MKIDLATQTMLSELTQRSLDADFDQTYDERGRFVRVRSKGRMYWHFRRTRRGKEQQIYVGPVTDKAITEGVNRFQDIKSHYKERRQMVLALIAAALPAPDPMTGDIADALWKAGFFRLRGFWSAPSPISRIQGILGKQLAQRSLMTQDLDAGQFYSISQAIGDRMPPILDVLRSVDETFLSLPDLSDPQRVWRFRNQNRPASRVSHPRQGRA